MSDISLAEIARALDAMLGDQMAAQARIAAHLVAAAEAAGHDAARVIATFDDVAASTALDEVWITDEPGVACITNVRDETGAPRPFRFDPDPAVQPQASEFHALLAAPVESDGLIAQRARVREIDYEIYKYVGVSGVDRPRIVQVGSALAFEEQALLSNAYTSPVMTAVMAAFGEPDLLSNARTDRLAEIRDVFEAILGPQMIVQAALADRFTACAEEAGWPAAEIDGRLRRIVNSTVIGELHVTAPDVGAVYTGLSASGAAGGAPADLLPDGSQRAAERPIAPRAADGALWKWVATAGVRPPRVVQVGLPIDDGALVSPRFRVPPSV